ncbi:MAG: T9SS type A sorting domain-containing protein, partial [Bacteroidetes bacterium]|nr:T9SS type A sorting domain-containing protein [Bacteroidota bacterium]
LAWPNPVEGRQLFIEVAATGPAEVRVMDASGRLVAGFSLALNGAAQVLNLPEMPKGLYLLRVVAGQRTGALPLVVQ